MPPSPAHDPGWTLTRGARATAARFRHDLAAQPRAALHAWLWSLAATLAAGLALSLGLCAAAMAMERAGLLAGEAQWLRRLEARGALGFDAAIWVETPGNGVFMIPVVLAAALLAVWLRRPLLALAVLSSYFVLDVLVVAGWLAWNRERPEVIAGGLAAPGLHAFPSGHVAQMVSAYGFFAYLWARSTRRAAERATAALAVLGLTAAVAWARLRLGAHWPSDVAAGALLGGYWLAATVWALRRAEARGAR